MIDMSSLCNLTLIETMENISLQMQTGESAIFTLFTGNICWDFHLLKINN